MLHDGNSGVVLSARILDRSSLVGRTCYASGMRRYLSVRGCFWCCAPSCLGCHSHYIQATISSYGSNGAFERACRWTIQAPVSAYSGLHLLRAFHYRFKLLGSGPVKIDLHRCRRTTSTLRLARPWLNEGPGRACFSIAVSQERADFHDGPAPMTVAATLAGSRPGFFVTFEGPDGSGKTTQIRLLTEWLRAQGHRKLSCCASLAAPRWANAFVPSFWTPEPKRAWAEIAPLTELALMFADRAQSIREIIVPALSHGRQAGLCAIAIPTQARRIRALADGLAVPSECWHCIARFATIYSPILRSFCCQMMEAALQSCTAS